MKSLAVTTTDTRGCNHAFHSYLVSSLPESNGKSQHTARLADSSGNLNYLS